MPRKYVRREDSRKYGYNEHDMKRALSDIRDNGMSVKKASFLYNINRTTLLNHVKNCHDSKVGRPTVLTSAEEALLVHSLKKLGDWGFGIDRPAVQSIVMDIVTACGRPNPFKDGKPGNDWMYGFEGRWKAELSRRVGQPLPANRAYACNRAVVDDFFDKLSAAVERLGLRDKPQNIFNVDETGFQTDIGSPKLFCKRGLRNPHKTVATTTKTMYTVQVCCSASGQFLPLYVVYKGLHLYNTWCVGGPEDARYNCSPSGWMESQQFVEWFQKVFISGTNHLEGNKLLVFDGHNSHISTTVVNLALANNIELLCLPAHTSSILQPLDVGVFKAVKAAWRKCLRSFYDESRYCNVDKRKFPLLLKKLVDAGAFSRTNAIHGFETCGIFPLNPARITADKISTSVPLTSSATNSASQANQMPNTAVSGATNSVTQASAKPSVLTPRKGIEVALLSHLRHVTPTSSNDKRVRIKRTLAESLTSVESRERLAEAERTKNAKKQRKRPRLQSQSVRNEISTNAVEILPSTPTEGTSISNKLASSATTKRKLIQRSCKQPSTQSTKKCAPRNASARSKKKCEPHKKPPAAGHSQKEIRKPVWLVSTIDTQQAAHEAPGPSVELASTVDPQPSAHEAPGPSVELASTVDPQPSAHEAPGPSVELASTIDTQQSAQEAREPSVELVTYELDMSMIDNCNISGCNLSGNLMDSNGSVLEELYKMSQVCTSTPVTLHSKSLVSDLPGLNEVNQNRTSSFQVGDYVAGAYCKNWYVGVIEGVDDEGGDDEEFIIKFMETKGHNKFCWPKRIDKLGVPSCDVLCVISPPTECKRFWTLSKADYDKSAAAFERWFELE